MDKRANLFAKISENKTCTDNTRITVANNEVSPVNNWVLLANNRVLSANNGGVPDNNGVPLANGWVPPANGGTAVTQHIKSTVSEGKLEVELTHHIQHDIKKINTTSPRAFDMPQQLSTEQSAKSICAIHQWGDPRRRDLNPSSVR